ncbi:MAG: DUF2384 domain-containing protein [Gemmataceae bacterium]|nr:DUF2384 domain-containing protein [Gemmataceae bacterium]
MEAPSLARKESADLRAELAVTREQFSRLAATSEEDVAAWEEGRPLSPSAAARLERSAKLLRSLSKVMKLDCLRDWLECPNPAFGGRAALAVAEQGDIQLLERMVHEVEGGSLT